jgi:hypothetical protein
MKEITVIFFCSWKFAATFPVAVLAMHLSFIETIVYSNIGGILGVLVFAYFSELLIRIKNKFWPEKWKFSPKSKKVSSKRNRRLVTIKKKYGLPGIVVLTPVLLSIPVGAFLITKYYGLKWLNLVWLTAGNIAWSVIFTLFYKQFV